MRGEGEKRFAFGYKRHNFPEPQVPQSVEHHAMPGSRVRRLELS